MEFEKLFSVVVLGGALLATGCGKKDAGNASPASSAGTTTEASTPERTTLTDTSREAAQDEPRLDGPSKTEMPKLAKNGEKCEDICNEHTEDGEMVCPIPDGDGATNCCWLMIPKHECCPS